MCVGWVGLLEVNDVRLVWERGEEESLGVGGPRKNRFLPEFGGGRPDRARAAPSAARASLKSRTPPPRHPARASFSRHPTRARTSPSLDGSRQTTHALFGSPLSRAVRTRAAACVCAPSSSARALPRPSRTGAVRGARHRQGQAGADEISSPSLWAAFGTNGRHSQVLASPAVAFHSIQQARAPRSNARRSAMPFFFILLGFPAWSAALGCLGGREETEERGGALAETPARGRGGKQTASASTLRPRSAPSVKVSRWSSWHGLAVLVALQNIAVPFSVSSCRSKLGAPRRSLAAS